MSKKELALFQVLHQRVLIQIVVCLPENITTLRRISGVGKKTIQNYGDEIMELVIIYRKKHGIDRVILPVVKDDSGKNTSSEKSASDP